MAQQRGIYTVSFAASSFTNANGDYDFFELTPADDRPIEIVAVFIGNKSEIGDAQDEMVEWSIVTDNATTGNGTSTTPRPLDPRDGSAGFTAEVVGSTTASTGTEILVHSDTFNIRAGLQCVFPPEMRPKADQADTMICIRMEQGLADDASIAGTVYVREL
jgi:hypothetical protein